LRVVAKELNVDGIVEGSVLRAGQKVRITAQLVDADADQHLWSESYEGTLSDVLALQSEVARAIASQLQIQLTPEEKAHLAVVKKVNPESNEAYLKGVYFFYEGLNHPSFEEYEKLLRKSFDYFNQAIKIDPRNALAHAGLASAYHWYAGGDHREYYPKSKAAALRALEIDDTLAEAHGALAYVLMTYDWDWVGAEREYKRSIQLNPSGPHSYRGGYALYLSFVGRHTEAIAEIKRTQELEPMVLVVKEAVAKIYINARKYDQAIQELQDLLRRTPNDPQFRARLGYAYYCKRMYKEAITEIKWSVENSRESPDPNEEYSSFLALTYAESGSTSEARKILNHLKGSNNSMMPYWVAGIYTALGEKDEAIQWLEKAFQRRTLALDIKVIPHFERLHSDPRFQDLIRRIGIP
jgi:tetratricopeptide (TPR) repeat protein